MSKKSDVNGSVLVNAQYIKDLSFENPKAPYSLLGSEKPEVDVSIDIGAHNIQEETYEVVLAIQVKSVVKEDVQYLIDLKYAGVFTLDKGMNNEEREKVIFIQCPTIIFPYARRVISDISRDGGYLPLYISPVDFMTLYNNNKNKNSNEQFN
ncbi:protein-export chaperone SecB [Rickettsiales endosymbiont of Trichoplax sp. H2]|uniref:protein-export chaperone SecB n=1 Tax=Rickettsiales endosymbiont of Trichoplax sp. H2 TaxID=2021221 RepID=UPI0012B31C9A|nr:protein-export chaperone SecB [Rickettsiales endosymbiont of Trichoplax sp. H2]MSO14079.1 Protein-export protein SecB [Rickettsiales endosymbiont of Trichoplax sp. H2]